MDTLRLSPKTKKMKFSIFNEAETESTRNPRNPRFGGSMSDAIPDISIFGDETSTWQTKHSDESSVYGAPKEVDPWSETFVQMQIGQSGKCIPTEGILLEKETIYKFQGKVLKSHFLQISYNLKSSNF